LKSLKYIALVLFAFLWFLGCSKDASSWLYKKGITKDDYRYGDLYRMFNLPQFKELKETCLSTEKGQKINTHLVLAGDSFTEKGRIDSSFFTAKNYDYIRVDEQSEIKLDTSQYNLLIIEIVERHFRERFANQWKGVNVVENLSVEKPSLGFFQRLIDLKMPYSTELHESVLFGYDAMMMVREWKATLTYKLFGRVDKGVKLNKSEEHLLYSLPSEPGISSAFEEIKDEDVDELVEHVNLTNSFYKTVGFDKVVLSIIPNKTSLLGTDLGTYNRLVERIQNNKNLEMSVIDLYTPFMKMGASAYAKGDTHWNCNGQTVWVDKANALLQSQ
jgi:hypothetical protein